MLKETIDREAGDSGKGFRLQQIRAIKLMLNTINENDSMVFFTAVENLEDVSHQTILDGEVNNYYEEDKNYALSGNFTIFSPPVINTLVSFFDIYTDQFKFSDNVSLGFYTTRSCGKERKVSLNDGTEIKLPDKPILKLIQDPKNIDLSILEIIKKVLIEEYRYQYKGSSKSGHLKTLENLEAEEFRKFLAQINWHFGQEDETELKATVLNDIKNSPLYNSAHIGKENTIFSVLMEKIGENQNSSNLVSKLVHSSDVKLVFKEVESQMIDDLLDPAWKHVKDLEKQVEDKRNLKEKVLSVIDDISSRRIEQFARKATVSKSEENNVDKTFLSLKYRIYEACEEYFNSSRYNCPNQENELDDIIQNLVSKALSDISDLKEDYQYTVSNQKTVEGVVWNLFDSCFLAFDEISDE